MHQGSKLRQDFPLATKNSSLVASLASSFVKLEKWINK